MSRMTLVVLAACLLAIGMTTQVGAFSLPARTCHGSSPVLCSTENFSCNSLKGKLYCPCCSSSTQGLFGYVTNEVDATVSEYSRSTTTGLLTALATPTIAAGTSNGTLGPEGIAIDSTNSYAFVANTNDGNIYQFTINSSTGELASNGSISNGSGSEPRQIAISTGNSFLWVTSAGSGSVNAYSINSSTGKLSTGPVLTGFSSPFGIVVHPTSPFLFVTDFGSGLIYSYTISTGPTPPAGTLTPNGSPVMSAMSGAVLPILLAVDPSGATLWVTDYGIGIVSAFAINGSGVLTPGSTFALPSATDAPVGVAIAQTTLTPPGCLYTANSAGFTSGAGSVTPFSISGAGTLTSEFAGAVTGLNGPLEVIVDPQNSFVYATESVSADVIQMKIGSSCKLTSLTPATIGAGSFPYGMALTH